VIAWGDLPTWLAVAGAFLGGGAALRQLRLQRIAFADQTRLQERQQADAVDVSGRPFDGSEAKILPPGDHQPVHAIIVTNGSSRPIREVAATRRACGAEGQALARSATKH
jgi:hypothetical protein